MKSLSLAVMGLSLFLGFSGCGGGGGSDSKEGLIVTQNEEQVESESETEVQNFGFSQSAQNNFGLVQNEYKVFEVEAFGKGLLYSLKDAPTWITINAEGQLVVDATGIDIGHYAFEIEVSNTDNVQTKPFEVSVYTTIETLNKMNVYTMKALAYTPIKAPVKSISSYPVVAVPNADGVSWDLLKSYYKKYWYNYEVVINDISSNILKRVKTTDNQKEFVLSKYNSVIAPNGKLFVTNLMRPNLNVYVSVYNPDTNSFEKEINTSRFEQGEKASIALGTNGKVYVGCSYKDYETGIDGSYLDDSRHASAFEIDPNTMEVTEFGKLGPNHAPDGSVWGYTVGADDTHVYVASGKIPWYLVSYNRETGEQKTLFTTEKVGGAINVIQYKYGVVATVTANIDGGDGYYWLLNGTFKKAETAQALRFDDCPWNPEGVDPFTTYKDVDLPKEPVLDDFSASTGKQENRLWYKADTSWEQIDYSVDVYEKELKNMLKLPDGNWLIAGREYSGYSLYNPVDKTVKPLGKLGLSGSLAMSVSGKMAYISGYSNSATYEYDPSKPWTQNNADDYHPDQGKPDFKDQSLNPRFLGYFSDKSGVHKPYNSAVDKDGKIYYVGRWYRNGKGGGLSWYDPKTKTHDGFYEQFSNYQLRHITSVMDGKYMLLSGTGVEDATLGKPTPTQGRLFLLDVSTNEVIKTYDPLSESMSAGDIIDLGNGFIMGMSNDGIDDSHENTYFYKMDVMSGEIIWKRTVKLDTMFSALGNMTYGYGFKKADDGNVYVLLYRKGLTRITPDGHFEQMGVLSTYGEIFLDGDDFYLLNKENVEFYKDGLLN